METLIYEMLRAPNFAPEQMSIVLQQANNPTPISDEMRPMKPQSFPNREFQLWFTDAEYDQCCDQEIHVPYTDYTFLVVGYTASQTYGGSTGPGTIAV